MKKLEIPDIAEELETMYKRIAKYGEFTQGEIEDEIQRYRMEKARRST